MKGFTIVELLVGVSIASLILVAIMRIMGTALPLYRYTFLQASANETARVQLKRMSHTIRSARTSDTGAFTFVDASPNRLIFYADIDTDAAVELVRYEKIGTDLVRGVTQPTGNPIVYDTTQEVVATVARYIQNGGSPVFAYYGSSYPSNATPLLLPQNLVSISYISFTLVIDADTTQDPAAVTVQSQVQLRNLKTNL